MFVQLTAFCLSYVFGFPILTMKAFMHHALHVPDALGLRYLKVYIYVVNLQKICRLQHPLSLPCDPLGGRIYR